MNPILRQLADRLQRQFTRVVERPMPWRVIDALVSLEETLEKRRVSARPEAEQTSPGPIPSDGGGEPSEAPRRGPV